MMRKLMMVWIGCVAVPVMGFGLYLAFKPDGAVIAGIMMSVSGLMLGALALMVPQRQRLTDFLAPPPLVVPPPATKPRPSRITKVPKPIRGGAKKRRRAA